MAQTDSVVQRVFLVGDAGELHNGKHEVVDKLRELVNWDDPINSLIFLGDNIYPFGMPMKSNGREYMEAKKIIDYQIGLTKGKKARTFFIPGNHDWENGKTGGWQRAMNQVDYINSQEQNNIKAYPLNGCPGPVVEELNDKVVVVFVDSQWFLYLHDKPGPGSNCDAKTVEEFGIELQEIAASHKNQLLIVATHHPLYSFGIHGGHEYGWKEWFFPLTVLNRYAYVPIPFVYPLVRKVFGNVQDVNHPLYRTMVSTIENALINSKHPNYITASGHEHNLQLILKDSIHYIVSGSGSNLTKVKVGERKLDTGDIHINPNPELEKEEAVATGKTLLFSELSYGFAMVEVHKSGRSEVSFYTDKSTSLNRPDYSHPLKRIDTVKTHLTKYDIPKFPDSVTAIANSALKESFFRDVFMGRNYRQEWTTALTMPVLNMGTEMGGIKPTKQGGGKQTKSLRVEDNDGKEYALRSIRKFPEAAIPEDLRSPFFSDIVNDGISASYPFASLSVAPISKAAGVPVIRRKLVYIPDDPRLERFRDVFKNNMAILEERQPLGVKKAFNTDELVIKLAKDNDDHVDQKEVLKARLVDNFIMDFDRHEDQWQWATRDTGKGKIYYPIPRDHDQAFFVNQGILPGFANKPWFVPELQGFRAKAKNIRTFNKPARNFDRFFLNELGEEDWRRGVDTFLRAMTDSVIMQAMQQQPREIKGFHADKIANTLKEKRQTFSDQMIEYYRFISKEVNVVGTNQRELFTIDKQVNGAAHVTINKLTKKGELSSLIYDRVFEPSITKEVRIYGLEDDDSFVVKGGATPIKVRIVGGAGNDHFVNEGNGGKLIVYDVDFEENKFLGNTDGFTKKLSNDPQVNMYNRLFYRYSFIRPSISAAYNIDDGLYLGASLEAITQGFRKEPYHMRHKLIANRALQTSSFYFRYEGEFIKAIGKSDLLLRADVRAPINITNFFGIGNETVYDKSKGIRYYRARYDIVDASMVLRRQLQSWMRLHYGAAFQYFKFNEAQNRYKYVCNTLINGLNPKTLYQGKLYAGADVGLDIDSRLNPILPTRGLLFNANVRPLFSVNGDNHNITQFNADFKLFISVGSTARLVYALRFGGGRNFGRYEFQQAQYLSGTENLRGYRKDRFAGRSTFYNNLEVRLKVAEFNTYLFPGSFGLFVFNDVGRVWADHDPSSDWHVGNGGGIWVAPIKRFVLTGALTRSKEEKLLPYVTFGFQF
jgi:hypothetical protein